MKPKGAPASPFIREITPFKQVLQRYGHNPWTEQVLVDVCTISDLEDRLAQYILMYKPSSAAKRDAAAIWLLWEACNNSYLRLTTCKENKISLQEKLTQLEKGIENWKVVAINSQSQMEIIKEALQEYKSKERFLTEQTTAFKQIEKENQALIKENQVLQGMVKKLTLEQGRTPVNHSRCESIIKQLKLKLGFATRQIAAVSSGEWDPADLNLKSDCGGEAWDHWDPQGIWEKDILDDLKESPSASVAALERRTITTPRADAEGGGNEQITTIPVSAADLKAMADHLGTLNRESFSRWCTDAFLLAGRERLTTTEIYRLMGICAAPEIRATLDRIRVEEATNELSLMAIFGEQIGRRNFIAQAVASAQGPNEDPENYLTRWALMQVMAGLVTVAGIANLYTLPFPISSLRDCAASLLPYYSGKLAVWQDGHPATLEELRGMVQQITTHAGPKPNIKKERVAYVAAMEPTVTYSNESGEKGILAPRGGSWRGRSRGRGNYHAGGRLYPETHRARITEENRPSQGCPDKLDPDMRRMMWRLLMQLGGDREKWDKAPMADIMREILRLQSQQRRVSGVTTPSAPPMDLPPPPAEDQEYF